MAKNVDFLPIYPQVYTHWALKKTTPEITEKIAGNTELPRSERKSTIQ